MSLIDRIRPPWQNRDPEVRASAVRQLGAADQELLRNIASGDEDARVRRIAVKKVDDPRLLLEIGRTDSDPGIQELATGRANGILGEIATTSADLGECERAVDLLSDPRELARVAASAAPEAVRRRALERVGEPRALADVVRTAGDPAIRQEALARLSDPQALRSLIQSEGSAEVALAALEKIDDPEELDRIAGDRSTSKQVRRRAREKLARLVPEDHPLRQGERRARLESLCEGAESLAAEDDPVQAAERFREIEATFREAMVSGSLAAVDEPLAERYATARRSFAERLERAEARERERRAEAERRGQEIQALLRARRELLERLEALSGPEIDAELAEIERRWAEIPELPDAGDEAHELAQRFATSLGSRRAQTSARAAAEALESELLSLVKEAEKSVQAATGREALARWRSLARRWPAAAGLPESAEARETESRLRTRFDAAGEQIARRASEEKERRRAVMQRNLERAQRLVAEVETLCQSAELSLKDADRVLREIQGFAKELGPLPSSESRKSWRNRLERERKRLFMKIQEQRDIEDWKRWANADLQEKLIQRMNALLEEVDLRAASQELRRLQDEWKQVGAAPAEKAEALWERFKQARDRVRARCEAFFAERDREREDNLRRKEALCERVEALAESTDWENTAEEIKKIQEEWKAIGAVPKKLSPSIWKRFRAGCDRFFERRKKHYHGLKREREENLRRKEELCERAERLVASTEWKKTAQELKRLQAEWKKIGAVPRKRSEAVWRRFRGACDAFFERYKRKDEVELARNLEIKELVCAELEALLDPAQRPAGDLVVEKVQQGWSRWTEIGPVPADRAGAIENRFRDVCRKLVEAHPDPFRGTSLDPSTNRRKKEKLVKRLEGLVDQFTRARRSKDPLEDLAARLKDAMATNMIRGRAQPHKPELDWEEASHQVVRLKSSWEQLAPIPGEAERALAERFDRAYSQFFSLRPGKSSSSPKSRAG